MTRASEIVVNLDKKRKQRSAATGFARGDHVELGAAMIDRLSEKGDLVHDDGALYRYDQTGHVFRVVDEAEQSRVVQGFAGFPTGPKEKPLVIRRVDVAGSMRLAWDSVARPGFFAAAPAGLAFANTFVKVNADGITTHDHVAEHRARFAFDFDFVPDACPALFSGFLAEVFRDDPDAGAKVQCIQEYVGASMLGVATKYQRALVKLGPGANGKGVLAAIIEAAMPSGSCSSIAPQDWADQYRLAMLAGKRLNIVSELPEADIIGTDAFKAVVSGDSMTGRHIRQAPFTFRPVAGHIFSANKLPGTVDQTHGFWRRFIVVEFRRVFTEDEQDPTLAETLIRVELPQIASWFLEGGRRLLAQGSYTVPTSSAVAVDRWKRHADQVRAFVEEWTTRLPLDSRTTIWAKASDVYKAYRGWAAENGHRPVAANTFGERMGLLSLASRHTEDGNRYPIVVETTLGRG